MKDNVKLTSLNDLFESSYSQYASETILERAIPYIEDGLKPVQRRILHTMYNMDDGRMIKASSVVGMTMLTHPHGDAGIEEALNTIARKNVLLETQGNFGNILTGDPASASRYLECRLAPIAKELLFSPKVTEWKSTYDARSKEPVFLPVKLPLLLLQGSDGIAVSLSCKILPHNFNELCEAAKSYLDGKPFDLYPDFQTGGILAVDGYNDGKRGGSLKCRAKIKKIDEKTLSITELPYGVTSDSLRDSIVTAIDKGKIKIKKVDDNTSDKVEIILHLDPKSGINASQTIEALYHFTDCEISISPNAVVIKDRKPVVIGVSDILKFSVDKTKDILLAELNVKKSEQEAKLHRMLLEKVFIEQKVYALIETAADIESAKDAVRKKLESIEKKNSDITYNGPITAEDLDYLVDLRFRKLNKFDKAKMDKDIAAVMKEIKQIESDIKHIVKYTIKWYDHLIEKYGKKFERRTTITDKFNVKFDAISVAAATKTLYVDKAQGFVGYDDQIKKSGEVIGPCSDIANVFYICKDGTYGITKIGPKKFVGPNILTSFVYTKEIAKKTVVNILYSDDLLGKNYVKRCKFDGLINDKKYYISGTKKNVTVWYASQSGKDTDIMTVEYDPKVKCKSNLETIDFTSILVKGKQSTGNMVGKGRFIRSVTQGKIEETPKTNKKLF